MADIKINGATPSAFYFGSTAATAVYYGSTKLWEASSPTTTVTLSIQNTRYGSTSEYDILGFSRLNTDLVNAIANDNLNITTSVEFRTDYLETAMLCIAPWASMNGEGGFYGYGPKSGSGYILFGEEFSISDRRIPVNSSFVYKLSEKTTEQTITWADVVANPTGYALSIMLMNNHQPGLVAAYVMTQSSGTAVTGTATY